MSERSEVARHERIIDAIEANNYEHLNEREKEEALQVANCITMMLTPHSTERSIVKVLKNEHNVSGPTAWNRLNLAKQIIGDTFTANRKWEILRAFWRAEDIYQRAISQKNDELALMAIGQMTKIKALDREDLSAYDLEKMQGGVHLKLPPSMERFFRGLMSTGVLDFSKIPEAQIVPPPALPQGDAAAAGS